MNSSTKHYTSSLPSDEVNISSKRLHLEQFTQHSKKTTVLKVSEEKEQVANIGVLYE
jgi:hypothetical protein